MTNPWNPEVYLNAWRFATHAHEGQTYGGPNEGEHVPYLNHIGAVAMEVMLALSSTPEPLNGDLAIQCALLHDVVEDTEHSIEDIAAEFGTEVAAGVSALTKDEALPTKREQMQDSLRRIKVQPPEVWMVKLADRITNLQKPPFYWDAEKAQKYRNEAQLIYDELHEANPALARRLMQKIEAYQHFYE